LSVIIICELATVQILHQLKTSRLDMES